MCIWSPITFIVPVVVCQCVSFSDYKHPSFNTDSVSSLFRETVK